MMMKRWGRQTEYKRLSIYFKLIMI
jgi:hypothetical protein